MKQTQTGAGCLAQAATPASERQRQERGTVTAIPDVSPAPCPHREVGMCNFPDAIPERHLVPRDPSQRQEPGPAHGHGEPGGAGGVDQDSALPGCPLLTLEPVAGVPGLLLSTLQGKFLKWATVGLLSPALSLMTGRGPGDCDTFPSSLVPPLCLCGHRQPLPPRKVPVRATGEARRPSCLQGLKGWVCGNRVPLSYLRISWARSLEARQDQVAAGQSHPCAPAVGFRVSFFLQL